MRNFIALIIMAGLFVSCAHHKIVPIEERQVQFVHEVELTKDQIFDRTLEWMAKSFNDSKDVTEVQDRVNGKIIGKGVISYSDPMKFGMMMPCRFVICIEIKDGKYRVTYDDFLDMKSINYALKYEPEIKSIKESVIEVDKQLYSYLLTKPSDW